jgi:hypothetical protein
MKTMPAVVGLLGLKQEIQVQIQFKTMQLSLLTDSFCV